MLETVYYRQLSSPLGTLLLTSDGAALTGLYMGRHAEDEARETMPAAAWKRSDSAFRAAVEQISAYFEGELTRFDLPMHPAGTAFQQRVWQELRRIPYGAAISYAELARRIGRPSASRAVGGANGRNPISIIVPCHRVISADGSLGGYGGGLDRKRWLLAHEAETLTRHPEWRPAPAQGTIALRPAFA